MILISLFSSFIILSFVTFISLSFPTVTTASTIHDSLDDHDGTTGDSLHLPSSLPTQFVSMNMVDLYWTYSGISPMNRSFAQQRMKEACSRRGFTFIRFSSLNFWPSDVNETYLQNPSLYWSTMDQLVNDAASYNCTLMPSLFWQLFVFPDLFNEPGGQVFNVQEPSKARDAQINYVQTFIQRYQSNPVFIAWELGNEYNLFIDLNATQQQPVIAPGKGTPNKRTAADNITTDMYIQWQKLMVDKIHQYNTVNPRPISSGNAIPRSDATWLRDNYFNPNPPPVTPDTREQFYNITYYQNLYVDWLSVHIYGGNDNDRWNSTDPYSADLLYDCKIATTYYSPPKVLYVGEFGDPFPGNRTFTKNVLAVMDQAKLPLGTVWIWNFYQFNNSQTSMYSIDPGRDDAIIEYIQAWNNAHQ